MSPESPADAVDTTPAVTTPAFAAAGTPSARVPAVFRDAVESMSGAPLRPGISLTEIRPPQRLAPFSHALGLEVTGAAFDGAVSGTDSLRGPVADTQVETQSDSSGDAFGRLILLHDPDGAQGPGFLRIVAYIQAEMDAATVADPLLPDVAWEWLTDGLDGTLSGTAVGYRDLGGTVSSTTSVRHGDIGGAPLSYQLEMRASWSATDVDLSSHVIAFSEVLAAVAGLPPVGVALLPASGGH